MKTTCVYTINLLVKNESKRTHTFGMPERDRKRGGGEGGGAQERGNAFACVCVCMCVCACVRAHEMCARTCVSLCARAWAFALVSRTRTSVTPIEVLINSTQHPTPLPSTPSLIPSGSSCTLHVHVLAFFELVRLCL